MGEQHGQHDGGKTERETVAQTGAAPAAAKTPPEGDVSKGKRVAEKVAGGAKDEAADRTGRFR